MSGTDRLTINISRSATVSALLIGSQKPSALFAIAHGAGASMDHPFMAAVAAGLAERGVATLRYQFPYMEAGPRRPDRPPVAEATVRAAVETAARLLPNVPLAAGGKSFGARMTTQAQANRPLPGVIGLVAFGFPLHAADDAEADVLAYMGFPTQHRTKIHSTNPIERLNHEIKRRSDVVEIFPNEAAITRLIGALLLEQSEKWAVQRARYMTLETIAPMSDDAAVSLPLLAA